MGKISTKTKTKAKKTIKKSSYRAVIKVLGKTYEAKGADPKEAITNLEPIANAKGLAILSILKGEDRIDKILTYIQVQRLFSRSKLMREIAIKNISMLFSL